MSEPSAAPRHTFVPVSETLRERGARSWLGDGWPRGDLSWLVAITAIAAVLRLHDLEHWSLSADEALTWRGATESIGESHGFVASDRSFYPLCFLGLRLLLEWGVLPFHGEGWLRLPFAFAGILVVPLLGLVGDLFVGRRAALLAAGLLAIHPWHVHMSQCATAPGVAVFFALLAAGTAWVGVRMTHVPSRVLAVVFVVLAGLAHPTGWLAGLALVGWMLVSFAPALSWLARAGIGAAVLGLVVAIVWGSTNRLGVATAPAGSAPQRALDFAVGVVGEAGVALCLLAVIGLLLWRDPRRRGATPAPALGEARGFLLAAAVVPFGVLLALVGIGMAPSSDDALPALPMLLLLAARAVLRCAAVVRTSLGSDRGLLSWVPSAVIPVALGLGLLADTYLYATVRQGERADWRTARDVVLQSASHEPRFTVLVAAGWDSLCYYLRPNHWREPLVDPHPNNQLVRIGVLPGDLAGCVARAGDGGGALFVVLTRDEVVAVEGDPAAVRLLARTFRLIEVLPCPLGMRDETIYVYRRVGRE